MGDALGNLDSDTVATYNTHMPHDEPELLSDITDIEIIAVNTSIRELAELKKDYGGSRWRKLKGKAYIRRRDGRVVFAEVHWYECHGIGRRRMKVKKELG